MGKSTKSKSRSKKLKVTSYPYLSADHDAANESSDSDSDFSSSDLTAILKPYSKEQLIDLISSVAMKKPSLFSIIKDHANHDTCHRKIFVYGLPWQTTHNDLLSVFEAFGEVEDCHVVMDRLTGKAKGYGFILYKTRKEAVQALKEPKKEIHNRPIGVQLASLGSFGVSIEHEIGTRKIYVGNVDKNTDKVKLKSYFSKFGEIESDSMGFDRQVGRQIGYAMFVYKTAEGARKALEEPSKLFDGQQLHCSLAITSGTKKNVVPGTQQMVQLVQQSAQGPVLLTVAAPQNLALMGQQTSTGSVYGGLLANQSSSAAAGMTNPVMAGAGSQGFSSTSYASRLGVDSQSGFGSYRQSLHHLYPSAYLGQAGISKDHGTVNSLSGYTSYL